MPDTTENITRIPLTVDNLPDLDCVNGWQEAFLTFIKNSVVEVPSSITNVKISNESPSSGERNYLWIRLNNSGSFVGFYIFADGDWQNVPAGPVLGAIYRVAGQNSESLPAGFALADGNTPPVSSGEAAILMATWFPVGSGPWTMFDMIFVGF